MDKNGNKIWLALDVSTATIGVCILVDDGSPYGKIAELTHISPKTSNKIKGIEQLFLKKKQFAEFIIQFKDYSIDNVVIEEPLISSNNQVTVATLLRFNGMISDCIYNILGIVPMYISSYDARKYSFPELMAIRKYGKDEKQYAFQKINKAIEKASFVLFGSYPWSIDKKTVIQEKVANLFPGIEWLYDKNNELKKENFDATDAYVACLGQINKERNGELIFTSTNVKVSEESHKIDYDVCFWGKKEHRTTFFNEK